MRLENQILDLYDDVNLEENLVKMASAMPPELRKCELPSIEDRDTKPETAFALQYVTKTAAKLAKFPIDTAVETFFSNQYFAKNGHKLPPDAQKVAAAGILKACKRFNLPPTQPVEKLGSVEVKSNTYIEPLYSQQLQKVAAEIPKSAAFAESPHFYALVKKGQDPRYGMPTPELVKEAAAYFDKYAREFDPEDRRQFAVNVSGRARELGVELKSAAIEKYAGQAFSKDLEGHLAMRRALASEPQHRLAYEKLAAAVKTETPERIADTLYELDKRAGLTRYYDNKIADAFYATFGTEKRADSITELVSNKRSELESHFGKGFVDSLEKEGMAAYEALPTDAKEIIQAIANGSVE